MNDKIEKEYGKFRTKPYNTYISPKQYGEQLSKLIIPTKSIKTTNNTATTDSKPINSQTKSF